MNTPTRPENQTVALPFRILPSRGVRIVFVAECGVFALLFGTIAVFKIFTDNRIDAAICAIPAIIFAFTSLRELFYLGPGGKHWIGVTPQGLTYTTPLTARTAQWSDIAAFAVRFAYSYNTLTRPRTSGYSVVGEHASGRRLIRLRANDFASTLAVDRRAAAQALADFLNNARERLLTEQSTRAIPVPGALKVATVAPQQIPPSPSTVVVRQ